MRCYIFLLLSSLFQFNNAFTNRLQANNILGLSRQTSLLLHSQRNADLNGYTLESQRQDLEDLLATIDSLQREIEQINEKDDVKIMYNAVEDVEESLNEILSQLVPPIGLSMESYNNSIRMFLNSPVPVRLALVKALNLDNEYARDYTKIPEVITKLYNERMTLTPRRLSDAMEFARTERVEVKEEIQSPEEKPEDILAKFYENGLDNSEVGRTAQIFLGRLSRRQENDKPTEDDLEILVNALDSSTFVQKASPFEISGAYVIRGESKISSGSDLIEKLDSKLPKAWNCSVSYMPDVTTEDDIFTEQGKILILYKNDFVPATSVWFYRLSTFCALATTILFSFGILGSNDIILNQLSDSTAIGDYSGLDLLNQKVAEFLIPFFVIFLSHEFGHFLVAKEEKIETSSMFPTLLPFWNNLPMFGSLTRITTPPRNLTALFDFAVLGPLLGMISSVIFSCAGLLATKTALESDSSALLPALPVSVLRLSTLGGSVVDNFFGGDGFITLQDPTTPVPLHPMFIAGFCGLLINAAEMLPLGATDGGRISLSLFGRQGHSFFGSMTWLALLIASFTYSDTQGEFLVGAWVINNIVQNDMEIPCRDETDKVNLPRAGLAFTLWFISLLCIIPMT